MGIVNPYMKNSKANGPATERLPAAIPAKAAAARNDRTGACIFRRMSMRLVFRSMVIPLRTVSNSRRYGTAGTTTRRVVFPYCANYSDKH